MTDISSMRARRLSPEEIEIWLTVAATVERRPGARLPEAGSKPATKPSEPVIAKSEPELQITTKTKAPRLAPLDRRTRQKLSRGRRGVDAAIDLHGLRQAEAHRALRQFLLEAQREEARIVLVVTGKGGRSRDPFDMTGGEVGVLKRAVPLWLTQPEFRSLIVGFEDAGRAHGGTGALYVQVRRRERAS
jgi:DNA-nicking Smr family endonuclease